MRYLLIASLLFLCVPLRAADDPARAETLRKMVESRERFWNSLATPPPTLSSRALFDYALTLCEARLHPDRLEKIFSLVAQMQDRDKASRFHGNFRWYWSNDTIVDQNAVDFCMQSGALLWLRHRDAIPAPARAILKELLDLGAEGCRRHRVRDSYTNIALMNAQNLILLGEALDRKDIADEGYFRLDAQCVQVWSNGVHEYVSPTYYGVNLDALGLIEAFAQRPRGREQALALLELFWTDISGNFYPPAGKLAGTRSRDYDYLRGLGSLDGHLAQAGWIDSSAPSIHAMLCRWRPPESLKQQSQSRFPRLVRQSWGERPCDFRTHYLLKDVTLSASGATYHNMDIPLSADLPGPRTGVRCYFISDGRHDPYGKTKIQEGKAHFKTLHLAPFFAATQRQTDALAVVAYRDKDIPEGAATLESHWVMPRDVDAFFVGDQRVDLAGKAPVSIPVAFGQPVVLRRGTAAVGIRVLSARTCAGEAAPVALVYDGNAFGAVRLTVDHRIGAARPAHPPAAALLVRVGSELDDQKFKQWLQRFAQSPASAALKDDSLHADAGDLSILADAPFDGVPTLNPPPARVVLEIDGKDVGRDLLQRVEPVKTYAQRIERVIDLPRQGLYVEAESMALLAPFAIASDPNASAGQFIWMPGETGLGGGSTTARATLHLKLDKPAAVHLWGRVIAPSPNDDSFFLRVLSGQREALKPSTWSTGVHKTWTWVRVVPEGGRPPAPLALDAGPATLELTVREDGTKLDRLFITLDPQETPK